MKVKKNPKKPQLSNEEIAAIEKELGVRFVPIKDPYRTPYQQFGIRDEDGVYAGGIVASTDFFTRETLIKKTKALFGEE